MKDTGKKLRILHVEDNKEDALLIPVLLREGGIDCDTEVVATRNDFESAVAVNEYDVILADYTLPSFDGLTALALARVKQPRMPFIFVTGTMGEDVAVESLKRGATDYVLKSNLKRLAPAVRRALREKEEQAQRILAQEELRRKHLELIASENRLRLIIEQNPDAIFVTDEQWKVLFVNPAAEDLLKLPADKILGTSFVHPIVSGKAAEIEVLTISGEMRTADMKVVETAWAGVKAFLIVVRDITARKRAEHALQKRVRELSCLTSISHLSEKPGIPIEQFLEEIVGILPDAWQYPEMCAACIALDSRVFKSVNFRETEWAQSAVIRVDGKKFGEVIICYLEERPRADEGPFLNEERSLIDTVGEFLGHVIQHRLSEAEIRDSEAKFRAIFDSANDGILLADLDTKKCHSGNAMICSMLGYSPEEIRNLRIMDIHPAKDIPHVIEQYEKQSRKEVGVAENLPVKRRDESVFFADISSSRVEISGRQYLVGIFRDITERKRAEQALWESDERYRALVDNTVIGIAVIDIDHKVIMVNSTLAKLLNRPAGEFVGKYCFREFENRDELCPHCPGQRAMVSGVTEEVEIEVERAHGRSSYMRLRTAPFFGMNGRLKGFIEMVEDISERKKAEQRIEYLAYYDALTGLPNRNLFQERLNERIASSKAGSLIACLKTDIDGFRAMNDTYGAQAGDGVLKEVARRLSTSACKGAAVARLGNDEFGILCADMQPFDDMIMFEEFIQSVSYPIEIHGDKIPLTFSTGISLYPHDGKDAAELLKCASLALSIAKKEGRKSYRLYSEDLYKEASETLTVEKHLFNALNNREFLLHYQPYWDIATEKMIGMEALIRWQTSYSGLIPPGKFIPVLEQTGMIKEAGEWILGEAIRQVKEWQNSGHNVVPVSVNLSLVQFRQRNLAEMVQSIIREHGFSPSLLTLEITESAFMQDIKFTYSVLKTLKDIGVSVSIDDFGTGYSSLAHLKRFPIDNLKIDISFVREMTKDPDSASIVTAIINMAHTLNLKTIAEGIETEEQWKFLRLMRCDMGQGFFFSKPLPADEAAKLFRQQ